MWVVDGTAVAGDGPPVVVERGRHYTLGNGSDAFSMVAGALA